MIRPAARLGAVAGLALLAACTGYGISFGGHEQAAGDASGWVRPNADPAQTAAEYQDCAGLAESATKNEANIDQDIAAARGEDMARDQIVRMQAQDMHEKTREHTGALIVACMRKKGFTRRP